MLTNDSTFSESLTSPEKHVPKTYLVETNQAIPIQAFSAFEAGMPFAKEGTRSQPAIVETISDTCCRLTIFEGLRHQVKRMFLRFGIRVTKLHRETVGPYSLGDLKPGQWRMVEPEKQPDSPRSGKIHKLRSIHIPAIADAARRITVHHEVLVILSRKNPNGISYPSRGLAQPWAGNPLGFPKLGVRGACPDKVGGKKKP